MKYGNWVPISKAFIKHLPKDRPYTEFEAAFSMQVDYDNGNTVTVSGYSELWRWSKKRVYRFLKKMGIEIVYPDNTQKKQNQRGRLIPILMRDRKETDKRLIRFVDSKGLESKRDRKETEKRLIRDRYRVATKEPNPNPYISTAGADLEGKILDKAESIRQSGKFKKIHSFINKHRDKNKSAIYHTLCQLEKSKVKGDSNCWAYCNKILQVENGNFNEQQYRERAEKQKQELYDWMNNMKN
jgi:hypothetical protein